MFKHTPGMTTGTRYYSDAVSLKSAHTTDPESEHVRPVRRDQSGFYDFEFYASEDMIEYQ